VLFERYLMVDWSAASAPVSGVNSIWIALADRNSSSVVCTNPRTRIAAFEAIRDLLADPRPTLAGFDFGLGYPRGFAKSLGLAGTPWLATWREIARAVADDDRNRNNRFDAAADWNRRISGGASPFWGCPKQIHPNLGANKPSHNPLPELRLSERSIRGPQPVWKLAYTGAVGSQCLMGIPYVLRLREIFQDRARVWPFETGLRAPDKAGIVFAEIYPSLVKPARRANEAYDRTQVRAIAKYFAGLDAGGELAGRFAPALTGDDARAVVEQEGWILGAGAIS
jgi:precorrin-8X/cobalt-precorrin-8 methylmutase